MMGCEIHLHSDPRHLPQTGSCQVSLSVVGTNLRKTGRVNCLGAELPQKCKETIQAIIKAQLLRFDSRSLSHRRWAGQAHRLY
jgi:hypothetical protein